MERKTHRKKLEPVHVTSVKCHSDHQSDHVRGPPSNTLRYTFHISIETVGLNFLVFVSIIVSLPIYLISRYFRNFAGIFSSSQSSWNVLWTWAGRRNANAEKHLNFRWKLTSVSYLFLILVQLILYRSSDTSGTGSLLINMKETQLSQHYEYTFQSLS